MCNIFAQSKKIHKQKRYSYPYADIARDPINDEGRDEMRADDGVWRIDETVWHPSSESYTAVFDFVIGEAYQNGNIPPPAGDLRRIY